MGTPIEPEPIAPGAACAVCAVDGQCFESFTPSKIRVTYSGISGCHPHNNPPDGPYILTQVGPGWACEFDLNVLPVMKHTVVFDDTAGYHTAFYRIGLDSFYYYMAFFQECSLESVNQIDVCEPGAAPPEIGVGGSLVIEPVYPLDLQFYAYGSGLFADFPMKYDVGDCDDGDKWYRFASVPERINILVKGKVAET